MIPGSLTWPDRRALRRNLLPFPNFLKDKWRLRTGNCHGWTQSGKRKLVSLVSFTFIFLSLITLKVVIDIEQLYVLSTQSMLFLIFTIILQLGIIIPFHRLEYWVWENLNDLPNNTSLIRSEFGYKPRSVWFQSLYSIPPWPRQHIEQF